MRKTLTVSCILVSVCLAAAIGVTALGFAMDLIPLGVIALITSLATMWVLGGQIYRRTLYVRVKAFMEAGDYAAAQAMLEHAESNQFFYPLIRVLVFQLNLKVSVFLDDIPAAAREIQNLRGLGGAGWRYRTAYFFILLHLDWDDIPEARSEYEAFKEDCGLSEIYSEQLEILGAIFQHIDGEGEGLPESAKRSEYPVVQRVLRKYC